MSNAPHGISVDDYYQEPISGTAWNKSDSSQSAAKISGNNSGSVVVRMKMITPSIHERGIVRLPDIPNTQSERRLSPANFSPSCYGSPYDALHIHEQQEGWESGSRDDHYWVTPGARTDNAQLTDAAWRNRFRENTAKINWRQRIEEEADRDRRERRLVRTNALSEYAGRPCCTAPFGSRPHGP